MTIPSLLVLMQTMLLLQAVAFFCCYVEFMQLYGIEWASYASYAGHEDPSIVFRLPPDKIIQDRKMLIKDDFMHAELFGHLAAARYIIFSFSPPPVAAADRRPVI